MSTREKHSQHLRLFFSMVGVGTAVVATLGYIVAALYVGVPVDALDPFKGTAVAVAAAFMFYQFAQLLSTRTYHYMMWRATLQWARVVMIVLLANLVIPDPQRVIMREVMLYWSLGTLPAMLVVLAIMRFTAQRVYGSAENIRSAIFVLPAQHSAMLALRLMRSSAIGLNVLGYFGEPQGAEPLAMRRLGSLEDVETYLRKTPPQVVFIGTGLVTTPHSESLLDVLSDLTASIYLVPEVPPRSPFQINVTDLAGVPLLTLHETEMLGFSRVLKRGLDVVVASLMLMVFAIPMLIIAIAIKQTSPGPVFFRQIRYGQDGKPISVYKFRSMHVHMPAVHVQQATRDDPRITPLGRILRRTSLDELPQILNVLDGSMSLVGPRPHAAAHNELYRQQIKGYMLRHSVKPGITGWAQINGLRGETDTLDKMMQRVEFDRYYIKHWSLWLDIKIIARTALLIVHDKKAY